MDEQIAPDHAQTGATVPVSVHFLNNVLAAAASYIEDDPDQARDVLAELSAFLSYRLRRPPRDVSLSQEIEHTRVYVRLEQARFPGRIVATLPGRDEVPDIQVDPAAVQAPVAEVLGRWLGQRPGPCRLALRALPGEQALELIVDRPADPEVDPERLRIVPQAPATTRTVA
jgi:two-component system, LytTR family, sensor kinase